MIDIKRGDGTVESMTVDEFTRWMCLVEAFDFIEKKAFEKKVDMKDFLNPAAIMEYIDKRFPAMKHDVTCEFGLESVDLVLDSVD